MTFKKNKCEANFSENLNNNYSNMEVIFRTSIDDVKNNGKTKNDFLFKKKN